ncbi:MAG TPA: DUF4838 domain-containing protein [Bryobacteraceae bacterium]|nr:DUF4838 domain-containing protein [Bryobacteraceae bacterium]
MRRRDFFALAAAAPLVLADGRESSHTICLSRDASLSEQHGARELQSHLEKISGAPFKIATEDDKPQGPLILIGRSTTLERAGFEIPFDELGNEGFALRTSGQHVAIAGGRQRGSMYGVYAFLERLGVRWYAPDCTYVPTAGTLQIPHLDEKQKPALEYREVFIKEATEKNWAARNRTNGFFSELDASVGGKVVYQPFVHSFSAIIPPDKYFGPHPEYFALVNGERRANRAQLCLTNPEVLRIAVETVFHWIAQYPDASIFSVSQNDADGPCECANCRWIEQEEGGAHSGPLLRFVNAVAAEVARKYPDKLIDTLAYRYSEPPPARVRPAPNVRVRLALSGSCDGHPFLTCPHNKHPFGILQAWARVTRQLYVWHYMTDFHQTLLPYPNLDELSGDIATYRDNGVLGLFMQGAYSKGGGGELAELRGYLVARLLWNPDLNAQSILAEFTDGFYGAAGPKMREYLELEHREVRLPPRGRGQSLYMYAGPDFAPDFMPRARQLFAGMKAATESAGQQTEARRIRKAEFSLDSVELFDAKRFVLHGNRYGPKELADFWKRYDAFVVQARQFGMTEFYENVPLEVIDKEYRRYMNDYPTVVLENATVRAVIVPGFQGRVVALFNKSKEQNALRLTEPDDRFTSMDVMGGLSLLAHPEFYSRKEFDTEWTVQSRHAATEVVLRGVCPNGLELVRTLRLSDNDPVLHTATVTRNRSAAPLVVTLQSRAQVNPGDRQNPTVDFSFPRRDGTRRRDRILPPTGDNQGDEFFRGDERPAGEWSLANSSNRITLTNRFADDQVERCRFWWRGRRRNTVAIDLWSPLKTLAPGETLSLDAEYAAE